jgi:hypothetical protein
MQAWGVVILLGCACGGPGWEGNAPDLFDIRLEVEPGVAFPADAGDRAALRDALRATSELAGRDPTDLAGLRLVLSHAEDACPGVGSGGCYRPEDNTAVVRAGPRKHPCDVLSMVRHEALHYFIGDPDHRDPRWSRSIECPY